MKYDMSGAAAVLAAASVVARLGLKINLIAVAPCTENLPGGHATKPGDVVTSMSGKTVEVINTDAEGRLVLIDGISYAQREGATRIVDVATLTGAIMRRAGPPLHGAVRTSGGLRGCGAPRRRSRLASGCGQCRSPTSTATRSRARSPTSGTAPGGRAARSTAPRSWMQQWTESTEWAHLDIASTAWFDEERPFSPKGPQGPTDQDDGATRC